MVIYQGRGREKEKLFNGYRVPDFQEEKNLRNLFYNNVNVLNMAELYT